MRRFVLLLMLLTTSLSLSAQLRSVAITTSGRLLLEVALPNGGTVVMNQYGEIKRLYAPELRVERYGDFRSYEAGKVKQIGDVRFQYYSDFRDYEAGKLKSIDGVNLSYYSDFRDYEAGKIKSIGGVTITYHSDFRDYEAGKIKSIGSRRYSYFSGSFNSQSGDLQSGVPQFTEKGIRFSIVNFFRR